MNQTAMKMKMMMIMIMRVFTARKISSSDDSKEVLSIVEGSMYDS